MQLVHRVTKKHQFVKIEFVRKMGVYSNDVPMLNVHVVGHILQGYECICLVDMYLHDPNLIVCCYDIMEVVVACTEQHKHHVSETCKHAVVSMIARETY